MSAYVGWLTWRCRRWVIIFIIWGGVSNMQMRCESTKCSPVIGWNAPIVSMSPSYYYSCTCTCQLCTCCHVSFFIVENFWTDNACADLNIPVIQNFHHKESVTNYGTVVFQIHKYRDISDNDNYDDGDWYMSLWTRNGEIMSKLIYRAAELWTCQPQALQWNAFSIRAELKRVSDDWQTVWHYLEKLSYWCIFTMNWVRLRPSYFQQLGIGVFRMQTMCDNRCLISGVRRHVLHHLVVHH